MPAYYNVRIEIPEAPGIEFDVALFYDSDSTPPWDREDGHGPVRCGKGRGASKKPGERALRTEHGASWLYDWQGAMQQAKTDGWGLGDDELAALAAKLGRPPTPGEIRAESVRQDFEYLQRYLRDEWWYIGVEVSLNGDELSVWGVESYGEYWKEVAKELAQTLWQQHRKEFDERAYWNARDVATV